MPIVLLDMVAGVTLLLVLVLLVDAYTRYLHVVPPGEDSLKLQAARIAKCRLPVLVGAATAILASCGAFVIVLRRGSRAGIVLQSVFLLPVLLISVLVVAGVLSDSGMAPGGGADAGYYMAIEEAVPLDEAFPLRPEQATQE